MTQLSPPTVNCISVIITFFQCYFVCLQILSFGKIKPFFIRMEQYKTYCMKNVRLMDWTRSSCELASSLCWPYFTWNFDLILVQDSVFRTPCPRLTQLKRQITSKFKIIPTNVLWNIRRNIHNLFLVLLFLNGGRVENKTSYE